MTAQMSRERLEALANLQSLECMALPASHAESAEMARMLLAGMDSEPVYQVLSGDAWVDVSYGAMCSQKRVGATVRTVYTAPPAPVAVPDESAVELLATDLMKRIDKITGERHSVATLSSLRVSIVEACRAAMLKVGPVTAATVPDGWKLVPVEPTKEMMLHKSGCQHHAWDDAECSMRQTRRLVWAHMIAAAPAAPEQEV